MKKGLRYVTFIGLLVGLLVVFITVYAWTKFSTFAVKSPKDEQSIQTFERLASEINALEDNDYKNNIPIFLDEDMVIAGFNKEWDSPNFDGCGFSAEKVGRPSQCNEKACLCLFDNSNTIFSKMRLIDCIPLNVDYVYSVNYGLFDLYDSRLPQHIQYSHQGVIMTDFDNLLQADTEYKAWYSYFLLYAKCKSVSSYDFQASNYYIDKYYDGDKRSVFINYASELNVPRIEALT